MFLRIMLREEWLDMESNQIKTYMFMGIITLISSLLLSYSYSALKDLSDDALVEKCKDDMRREKKITYPEFKEKFYKR